MKFKYICDKHPVLRYTKLEKPFKNFNDFFDEYLNGGRFPNEIHQRYLGSSCDVTLFWRVGVDEYIIAYVYPIGCFDVGYHFYVRNDLLNEI